MSSGRPRVHNGHQRSGGVWQTETHPRVVNVAEHARDAIAERRGQEGREDDAGAQGGRGRRPVRPDVVVRCYVLSVRRQDCTGAGDQT